LLRKDLVVVYFDTDEERKRVPEEEQVTLLVVPKCASKLDLW
jgi:hypothetical protein